MYLAAEEVQVLLNGCRNVVLRQKRGVAILVSFSLPPAETLTIILDEPSFSNQTISFGEESVEVNKFVLAAHSTYFRSLWFLDSLNFFSFIKSFYGQSFILNENNAYDFYYLTHYFQVDKLVGHVETHLKTHLVTWAWLKPFIKAADERNDLRALEFVGPSVPKLTDFLIDDVMAITDEGLKLLSNYCTSTQSQLWFIQSLVKSFLNQSLDGDQFSNILSTFPVESLSFKQWDEFLFVPLNDVKELETLLMKFLFTRLKNVCVTSLVTEKCS
ncbi:hypothetical protein GEMRC1_004843 [Eukaryota sp. GEM-RC1]